ncbi:MAG: hypothetical protein JXA06_02025 [Bacteroidetes bacterium]|nr:hypothetical protein [Bacteroidota bacterium]
MSKQIIILFWNNYSKYIPIVLFASAIIIIIWQVYKPDTTYPLKRNFTYNHPLFGPKEFSQTEKRIAHHFAADTLPGLMQKGLISKYSRNKFCTSITVDGNLWKKRSQFFKTSLLAEILVFNKVNGYNLITRIIDKNSGNIYAYLSPEEKIDIYD